MKKRKSKIRFYLIKYGIILVFAVAACLLFLFGIKAIFNDLAVMYFKILTAMFGFVLTTAGIGCLIGIAYAIPMKYEHEDEDILAK